MMKLVFAMAAATALIALPAASQDRPAGYWALDCDPDMWTAVRGSGGQVLYWNNRTCVAGSGGSDDAGEPEIGAGRGGGGGERATGPAGGDSAGAGTGSPGERGERGRGSDSPSAGRGNNRSGLGDGTNPGRGAGRSNSPNTGTDNPGGGKR